MGQTPPISVARRGVVLALALVLAAPAAATARIGTAETIDGPSADILEVGGVALAPDGTGGVVYRKRVDGRLHIFAARLQNGRWEAPQRVDVGQAFDSEWPRIAAGENGRLLVVWTHPASPTFDRLYSATIAPGASRFQPPATVDFNVGRATGTDPSLSVNAGGQALVTYRVITGDPRADGDVTVPPNFLRGEFRLARFRGFTWSRVGVINRNPNGLIASPTASNGPQVALNNDGSALVAWQEPDDSVINRIWARRVFGQSTLGNQLIVSPQTYENRPVAGAADAFSLSSSSFGFGAVLLRQLPDSNSALKAPAVFANTIAPVFDADDAATFGTPALVPTGPAPGVPAVSADPEERYRYVVKGGDLVTALNTLEGPGDQATLAPATTVTGDPQVAVARTGAWVGAWPSTEGGLQRVAVFESPQTGDPRAGLVAAAAGGPIADLSVDGSGLGDAVIGFRQGGTETGQIAVAVVDSPPQEFPVSAPIGWVKPAAALLEWEVFDAFGARSRVLLDGRPASPWLEDETYTPPAKRLDTDRYRVQVIVEDTVGQQTVSASTTLKVDGDPPTAQASLRGARATVTVSDGERGQVSGVASAAINWGDGARDTPLGARARHTYERPGTYRVAVRLRDEVGNTATVRRKVRVR